MTEHPPTRLAFRQLATAINPCATEGEVPGVMTMLGGHASITEVGHVIGSAGPLAVTGPTPASLATIGRAERREGVSR